MAGTHETRSDTSFYECLCDGIKWTLGPVRLFVQWVLIDMNFMMFGVCFWFGWFIVNIIDVISEGDLDERWLSTVGGVSVFNCILMMAYLHGVVLLDSVCILLLM